MYCIHAIRWDLTAAADEVVHGGDCVGGAEFAELQEQVAEVQGRCSELEEELREVRGTKVHR